METDIQEALAAMFESSSTSEPSDTPLLSVSGLSVHFGGLYALIDLTFEMRTHELVAVVGPNGAGKTTLLNAINGLLGASASGLVTVNGRDVSRSNPADIARLGVARSFQNPPLIDSESVLTNVMLGAHLRLRYRMLDQIVRRRRVAREEQAAEEQARTVLSFADLGDRADQPVGSLPYGSRKLIDILRTLMSSPRLLLLDEPTSGLDSHERDVVKELLIELRRSTPLTMLVVEHHMDIVRATAQRVIGLQAGTMLAIGSPSEVLDSEAFRAAVVGNQTTPTSVRAGTATS